MLPFHFIRSRIGLYHRLIKITDTTLDVVISGFGCNSFTFTLRQKPRGVSRRQREPVLRRLRETPLGVCLRVIMNEFHPELVNTTSIVLFIIFINLWSNLLKFNFFDKIVQVVFQFTPVQQSSTKK